MAVVLCFNSLHSEPTPALPCYFCARYKDKYSSPVSPYLEYKQPPASANPGGKKAGLFAANGTHLAAHSCSHSSEEGSSAH